MSDQKIHDYLMRGIHGDKELLPGEKNRYLGTYRERVIVVLTQAQVRRNQLYPQIEQALSNYPDATMLINGEMEYAAISKYIKLAIDQKVSYSKYSDHLSDSDLGVVIAVPYAVEIEQIEIIDTPPAAEAKIKKEEPRSSLFAKLRRRK